MKISTGLVVIAFISWLYFIGCDNRKGEDTLLKEGRNLAVKHCKSCHLFPAPSLLDKKTWAEHVLPKMSVYLGFRHYGSGTYYEDGKVKEAMSLQDWKKLVAYYIKQAPDSLTDDKLKADIQNDAKTFIAHLPFFSIKSPATTFVGFDKKSSNIIVGDGATQKAYFLFPNGVVKDSFEVGGEGVSQIDFAGADIMALTMGVLHPSDEMSGKLVAYNHASKRGRIILDSLRRPVYIEYEDLNGDQLKDLILCEFGNTIGQLSWLEQKKQGGYLQHVLRPLPGATKTKTIDLNKDGSPDIMALMAQGDEGIFVYYNQGKNLFQEQRVLQFPPSYGMNYFELADFDADGDPDILTTNGDNGDYPPILKPYHGIRIFFNDGKNNFSEKLFLPMNGVGKAIAKDFDGDGDLDIASISFFPDFSKTPNESFIYWENKGELSFQAHTIQEAKLGRWLTMEAEDIDGDGDPDIILGNAKFTLGNVPKAIMNEWDKYTPSYLVLKNTTN